ncbi:MAG: deoxyhypusine synthase family protein [Candidatus Thermoplasmatota archaeon]|nr:deoxyhypusine synthase family protein [Candidatus Thermoplasmatota archaeon]MDI6856134.1 deoxyhypusine synthase family protein [Candidatus Thermoplasmatota archaeon]
MKREDLLNRPVISIDLEKVTSVKDLVESFKFSSIQARNIAKCAQVYENMLTDKARPTIFLGLSGPLIAGGLRKVIADMIEYGIVDVIVTIGAIPYQDFYNARGYKHYIGSTNIDDVMLRDFYIDRIYDTFVDERKFQETDLEIGRFAAKLEQRSYSSREFLELLGKEVKDSNSIIGAAVKHNVPIFCPTIHDSSIGIGLTEYYAQQKRKGKNCLSIDLIRDNWEIVQIKIKSKKTGVIYIGGGVPKNYIQQTAVIGEVLGYKPKGHDYAFQITTDSPQWGGLSGCTLEEAQSWGKIAKNAKKACAYVEATVALPLIVGYILQKGLQKNRERLKFYWDGVELKKIAKY